MEGETGLCIVVYVDRRVYVSVWRLGCEYGGKVCVGAWRNWSVNTEGEMGCVWRDGRCAEGKTGYVGGCECMCRDCCMCDEIGIVHVRFL